MRLTFIVACLVFLGLFGPGAAAMLSDPDTLWHTTFGTMFLATGTLPSLDHWSYTSSGEPWIAKEWLSQAAFAAASGIAGWNGVVALAAFAGSMAFALLTWFAQRRLPRPLCYAAVAAAFVLSAPHLLARPHILALPLLVVWVGCLSRACDEGRSPSRWLWLVMVLWSNLHAGFTLGLAFAVLFAFCAIWEAPEARRELTRGWTIFVLSAVLACGITPYGYEPLLVTPRLLSFGSSLAIVTEWRPTDLKADKGALVIVLGWCVLCMGWGTRVSWPRALMILVVLYLFFTAMRNGEILGFILPFLIKPSVGSVSRKQSGLAQRDVILASTFAILAALASVVAARAMRPLLAPNSAFMPVECLSFARDNGLASRRVLNAYEFGGYLIAQGVPTFIDGRTELFGPKTLDDYDSFQRAVASEPTALIERAQANWTLLLPEMPIVRILDLERGWRRAFTGRNCVVHTRAP